MSEPALAREELTAAIKRLADGHRNALEFIYEATSAKLFGICLRILGSRDEAEDALQDVYVSLWRSADHYVPDRASPIKPTTINSNLSGISRQIILVIPRIRLG